jgi:hypothetical protein
MERKRLSSEYSTKGNRGGARKGSGRKKGAAQIASKEARTSFADRCRQREEKVLERIDAILDCDEATPRDVIRAGELLLAYGYGRPPQMYNVEHNTQGVLHITPELLKGLNDRDLSNLDVILDKLAGTAGQGEGRAVLASGGEDKFAATVGYSGQG